MPFYLSYQHFAIYSFTTDPDGIRAYRLEAVENGAGEGCDFCVLLLTNLKDDISCLLWERADCWVHLALIRDSENVLIPGMGLRYNSLIVRLVRRALPRPRALDIDDGGEKHEFAVVADQGKSCPLKNTNNSIST
jgi:hypothetical protein